MEKRSHRRIRDLDVLTAFQSLVANEIGCARISMMASEQQTLPQWAEYRCARPIISRSSHPACTARPVHTRPIISRSSHPACTARPVHTKYMVKRYGPPSQGWRTFLRNHAPDIGAMDLFVVPTIGFDLLYVLVMVRLARRDLVWVNVTSHPTAEWIAR